MKDVAKIQNFTELRSFVIDQINWALNFSKKRSMTRIWLEMHIGACKAALRRWKELEEIERHKDETTIFEWNRDA